MRAIILIVAACAASAEVKPLPGQAGNDDIELVASVLLDHDEIHQALGADLGDGYIVMHVKATPKMDQGLRIGPDDFTAVSRKDGQRSQALAPSEIAGSGSALVVKPGQGVAGRGGSRWSLGGIGAGSSGPVDKGIDASIKKDDGKPKDNALLTTLKEKGLPDKETKTAVEGYLYFPIDGKIKPKDIALIYKGPAGKLIVEFASQKGGR